MKPDPSADEVLVALRQAAEGAVQRNKGPRRIAFGPPQQGRRTPINVRMDDDLLQMIDVWRTWQGHGELTRPEAIRRLVRDRLLNS